MGGPRLTPEQFERAAAVFAATANVSEAARAIDVNESTLRSAFERERIARNREAHARACEEGLHEGLTYLLDVARKCHGVMVGEVQAGEGLSPQDFAGLGRTVNQALATIVSLAEREEKRRQAALTRRETRAKIKLLENPPGPRPGSPGGKPAMEVPQILATPRLEAPAAPDDGDGRPV